MITKFALGTLMLISPLCAYAEFKTETAAPLAQALGLALGTTIWAEIKVSTEGPVIDVSKLVSEGYYKLEIIELILMSAKAGKPLKETVAKRKEGAELADLARDYHLDYEKLYEAALAVQEIVDGEYLPLFPERRSKRERDEP